MGAVTVGTRAQVSPFTAFDRESWRALAAGSELPLDAADVRALASLGDRIDLDEVATVYLPLARLMHLHVTASRRLSAAQSAVPGRARRTVPFVIAVAGSVAVGKSTAARLWRRCSRGMRPQWRTTGDHRRLPAPQRRPSGRARLLERKGFPESYDRRALLRFVADLKAASTRSARRSTRT